MKVFSKKESRKTKVIEFKKVLIFGGFMTFLGLLVGLVYGGYLPPIFLSF